jgi:hypothetical protein
MEIRGYILSSVEMDSQSTPCPGLPNTGERIGVKCMFGEGQMSGQGTT